MNVIEKLTEPEGLDKLSELAAQVPLDECIVELGVHQGGSLVRLAQAHPHVYGCDPWGLPNAYPAKPRMRILYNENNQAVAQQALDDAGVKATLIRGFSTTEGQNWKGPKVGLLYVDAMHTERAVLADVKAWLPHLTGWVCFDDYNRRYPGVMAAVDRLCLDILEFVELVGTRLAVTQVRSTMERPR
jgi:hypothetical protein